MAKKIFGGLFLGVALLMLISVLAGGELIEDRGSAAATYGSFAGKLIPIALYFGSGAFLLAFDKTKKRGYIDAFKVRGKQINEFIAWIVVYALMTVGAIYSLMLLASSSSALVLFDSYGSTMAAVLSLAGPYVIPFGILFVMFYYSAMSYRTSKKYFLKNDAALNAYLSPNETFYKYSDDGFVLASNKALFFPTLSCVVPFNQIKSVELKKQLWEQDVYFHLTNGKKFFVVTKHYDKIVAAINANRQA